MLKSLNKGFLLVFIGLLIFPGITFSASRSISPSIDKIKPISGIKHQTLIASPTLVNQAALGESGDPTQNLGEMTTLTGEFQIIHWDNFLEPEKSRFDYYLKLPNKKIPLQLGNQNPPVPGKQVTVTGQLNAGGLVVSQVSSSGEVSPLDPSLVPESVGEQQTLVLLVRFSDSGPEPFAQEEIEPLVFAGSVGDFYHEQSYGRVSFSTETRGWFTLPRSGFVGGTCPYPTLGNTGSGPGELDSFLLADGINFADYDRVIMVIDHPCLIESWSTVGKNSYQIGGQDYRFSLSTIVNRSSWNNPQGDMPFPWTYFDHVVSHELGHALGLMHANAWDCGTEVLHGNCQHIEYGNFFDTMGIGSLSTHFNAFEKEYLGWLRGNEVKKITQSGRYLLRPLENQTGVRGAKIIPATIPGGQALPFYLEYRRGIGFDANLADDSLDHNEHGLFINRVIQTQNQGSVPASRLLDLVPTSEIWQNDLEAVTLNPGAGPFVDTGLGLAIGPVISSGSQGILFDITLTEPTCTSFSPTLQPASQTDLAVTGQGAVFASITNQDSLPCSSSPFTFEFDLPTGWSIIYSEEGNFSLAPQVTATKMVLFTVPSGTIPGYYDLVFRAINNQTGLAVEQTRQIQIVPAPIISSLQPPSATVGTPVIVHGANFDPFSYNNLLLVQGNNFTNLSVSASPGADMVFFAVSANITGGACNCSIPTPPGNYALKVYSNGVYSNTLNFEVLP